MKPDTIKAAKYLETKIESFAKSINGLNSAIGELEEYENKSHYVSMSDYFTSRTVVVKVGDYLKFLKDQKKSQEKLLKEYKIKLENL